MPPSDLPKPDDPSSPPSRLPGAQTVGTPAPVLWDPRWREPLPLDDIEWDVSVRTAAQRWMRAGSPADPWRALYHPDHPNDALMSDRTTCNVAVNTSRSNTADHLNRLRRTVLYRAEIVARYASASSFFKWFDEGMAPLPSNDQRRLLVKCLLQAFDTDNRTLFTGLWQRWQQRIKQDCKRSPGWSWARFLDAEGDVAPVLGFTSRTTMLDNDPHGVPSYMQASLLYYSVDDSTQGFHPHLVMRPAPSSHPWHLPFVTRALGHRKSKGLEQVKAWAASGECPVSAWVHRPMGSLQEMAPVYAMALSFGDCAAVWGMAAQEAGVIRRHGRDLLEGWLLAMIREPARDNGRAKGWADVFEPWLEAGARLPHDRDPNRAAIAHLLPSFFAAPGARTWAPAVHNRQNNVPEIARAVWTLLAAKEQHLDEVAALRTAADQAHLNVLPKPPRSRL